MSNLLYNGVELPPVPAHDADATVEVISAVLPAALSMYAQSPYILVIGKGTLWQSGKCYVRGVSAVYRLSGDAWMWHYGSGTVSAQDIVAANYFEAIWTNTDIPTADGAGIYLAASAPVDPNAPDEPEPEEPPVEPDVDVAAIYRRGWMDGFLSGINIRGLLRRRKVEEPQPVTAYLYGTPSPTVVTYNGVELPELPEWDKETYPYAYINVNTSNGLTVLCVFRSAAIYGTHTTEGVEYTRTRVIFNAGEKSSYGYFTLSDNSWGAIKIIEVDRTGESNHGNFHLSNPVWCNTDIPNEDNNTTYLAASEPVYSQVGGNVALADGEGYVLYDGAVLPPLPEWDKAAYPYAVIVVGANTTYIVLSKTVERVTTTGAIEDGTSRYCYPLEGNSWGELGNYIQISGEVVWSNGNVYTTDSKLYLAASDPIPLASAEPVAAVYGGVKLPVLPEYDAEAYPYAVLCRNKNTGIAELHCLDAPLRKSVSYGTIVYRPDSDLYPNFHVLKFALSDTGEWTANESNPMYVNNTAAWINANSHDVLWTNTDMMDEDGKVYLAASKPVPIYEKRSENLWIF